MRGRGNLIMKLEESQSVRPEGRMGRVPKVNLISDVTFSPRRRLVDWRWEEGGNWK